MTTRRSVLLTFGAGALAAALPTLAQQQKRVRRIGFLVASNLQSTVVRLIAFRAGMTELRWVEGRDYLIDTRYANGVSQAMPGLAAELVATKPDLLLVPADEGLRLLATRTKTIPIVFALLQDPLGNRVVANLQRPGGNATGLTSLARELGAKRLQLLREAFPQIAHVVVLIEVGNLSNLSQVNDIKDAAERLKMRITSIEISKAADIEPAFKRGATLGAQAYMTTAGPLLNTLRQAIADRALRSRIPLMGSNTESTESGGLMSYASYAPENFRRAAGYVDKIFKGANPGDLPIEQPTKFEFVINMKTAKAMGLTIPQSVLLQADRVIE